MTEQDILMQEGMNLLYSGMVVVFSFLLLLIISVNLLRILFSSPLENTSELSVTIKNDAHHKIIKELLGGIRS
ncbi:OadG family transporter subunit [Pseudomonadota bacterium]|nr:OadG family transporter subunit [Pseudomonadota bacterium]